MLLRNLFCLMLFVIGPVISSSQTLKISALKKDIEKAKNPNEKLAAIFSLCEETESLNIDTLFKYALEAKSIASRQKNNSNIFLADYYAAYSFYQKSNLDSSLKIINDDLPLLEKQLPHGFTYTRFCLLNGRCLMRKQQFKEALTQYYKTLNEAEENKDTLVQMMSMSGIGWAKDRTGDTRDGLNWFLKAISLGSNPQYIKKTVYLYSNTAIMYSKLSKNDSAELYILKAIRYARQTENLTDLANGLAMYAGNLMDTNRYPDAEAPLKEAIEVHQKIGDPFYIITDMGTLAVYYSDRSQPQKGIALCLKAIQLSQENHIPGKLLFLYDVLAKNYQIAGDYKNYGNTLERLAEMKDSVYQQNSAEAMAELNTKYEVQKKENTIIHQQLDLVKKDYQIYAAILLFILIASSAFLFFRKYKKRQKQKAVMAIAGAEESERKRIAADLHDNLGAYAASIASNVNRIAASQNELIDTSALQELRNNSNAIVADLSDTIWALKKEGLRLTAISDRLKIFIHRVEPGYPGISIDVNEEIEEDHLLSPSQGFHLFQTLQEAINNALKHSHCRHINILIESKVAQWKISVCDDGTGMTEQQSSEGGNGLYNMKNRAGEAGWKINWNANKPSGTVVVIQSNN